MNRIINKHDVFISWTGADRELKNTVADFLRNNGISCLESDHSCSGDFRQWSREAVSRCNIFLLIGSVNIFNSQWVPVEIEEFKKLDNFKNRIVPLWVTDEARLKECWGISEYASGVILDENGLTEDALKDILSKVKLLLIDFLDREYKEASKSEYIKLISLSRKSKSIDRDFDFSKLYINRTLHETDDKGAQLNEYPGTDFLYESDSVCFICGPAGCGKSQYINQIREDSPADVIIIRLPCSKASSAADVFSEAYKEFSRVCGNRFFYSENDFASLLNSRRVVLIFDGMDEIATTENKRRLIAKAEEFGKANKGNVTLTFTSRNLADAALIAIDGKSVRRFRLENLSEDETNKLLTNLFICFRKEDKTADFFIKAKDLDDEIRSNPLLLSQLAIIYDNNGDIPKTLVGIYDTITEITLKLDANADIVIPEEYKTMIARDISAILKSFARTKYALASKGRSFDTERIFRLVLEVRNYSGDIQQMSEFLVDYLENRALFVDGEFYHKMFLEYFTAVNYYEDSFDALNTVKDETVLRELFSHYDDPYWSAVIKMLLIKADSNADKISAKELYEFISQLGICEYTLLFDTCRDLIRFKEEAQAVLAADIIRKSAAGVYPAYGPLFWYVPEYGLYEVCLTALKSLKSEPKFGEMLALVRDVCFIFSGKYTAEAFIDKSACTELFNAAKAKLSGVRKALCELFYLGNTDFTGGDDIYPRCFNVSEAASFMENGCGVIGRMSTPFKDELGLFEHTAYNELNGEFIGAVSCPYVIDEIENVLTQKSCRKLSCLILSPSDNDEMPYIAINKNHVRAIYIPENVIILKDSWNERMPLSHSITVLYESTFYFSSDFSLPNGITEIPTFAFRNCVSLKSIVIPNSVTSIGNNAFWGCTGLKSIIIPDRVTSIGDSAFLGCDSLTNITIPDRVTSIGDSAFWGCDSLTNITIPDRVTSIGDSAFSGCNSLTNITIPDSVTSIGDWAFWGCDSLTNITIPDSVTSIGNRAFGCTGLTSITIPDSITSIGESVFSGCASLSDISIPDSVTSIGNYAFSYCTSLTSITIPDSVTSIGDYAFIHCTNFTSITIPDSVTEIGLHAFCGTKISIPNNVATTGDNPSNGSEGITNIIIPDGVTSIDNSAFSGYASLTSVTIPDSVTSIGDSAFEGCESLASIIIPDSVTSIGAFTFSGCKSLTNITIPDSVTSIGDWAFWGCDSLTNITIPDSVTSIGAFTFSGCKSLNNIIIPDSVTSIGGFAFYDCESLTNIHIPDSVTSIGFSAFLNCSNLETVTIPISVTNIVASAFKGCSSLKRINIPDSVINISAYAFENCTSLEEIEIPSSVRVIGDDAFEGCTGLTRVVISRRFEDDIERIFGNINRSIITFF